MTTNNQGEHTSHTTMACSNCGKTLSKCCDSVPDVPSSIASVAASLLSKTYDVGMSVNYKFLHAQADVECPKCGEVARVEVRL